MQFQSPRLTIQEDESQPRSSIDLSPETVRVLQALEQGKRSQIIPMQWPVERRDWKPRESA